MVRGGHCRSGEETANVSMTGFKLYSSVADASIDTVSMVLAHASGSELLDCSRSTSGTSRTRRP
jgi:hypothetical protein